MFEKLFASRNPTFIPMQSKHIKQVVDIIAQTDEDDAEEAAEAFSSQSSLQGMFVLVREGQVLGVTGYTQDYDGEDIAWLSWTYVLASLQGQGIGTEMFNDLLGRLNQSGIRKLFMSTSDYREEDTPIYEIAHRMYESFGAVKELTVHNYHSIGEAKIIYGLDNPEYPPMPGSLKNAQQQEAGGLEIVDFTKAEESEDTLGLTWQEIPGQSGLKGFEEIVLKIQQSEAKQALLTLPSDLSSSNEDSLLDHGFQICGQLENYYAPDIHQIWWAYTIEN